MTREQESTHFHFGWLVALLAYFVVLAVVMNAEAFFHPSAQPSLLELSAGGRTVEWPQLVRDFGVRTAIYTVLFVPMGFLTALSLPRRRGWFARLFAVLLPATVIATILSGAVVGLRTTDGWSSPTLVQLILPTLGCLLGAWIGAAASRGALSVILLVPKVAVLALILTACVAALALAATSSQPLDLESSRLSSDDRRALVDRFRGHNPMTLGANETRSLMLPTRELQLLLAWAFDVVGAHPALEVNTRDRTLQIRGSARIPGANRYLNASTRVETEIQQGRLNLDIRSTTLGTMVLPEFLLAVATRVTQAFVGGDESLKTVVGGVQELHVGDGGITVSYGRMDLRGGVLPRVLAQLGPSEAILTAARAQLDHFASVAPTTSSRDQQFQVVLRSAFTLAKERSAASNPIVENSGAVLALGAVLGHSRVGRLAGLQDMGGTIRKIRAQMGTVTLRGRSDWTQHFFVSAGLTQLATAAVSDAVGVLKEELDAEMDEGGSGFSFADLMADRAGTMFADSATKDIGSARRAQDLLTSEFAVDDLFPAADGLPEGIPDAIFQSRYGGVGGEEYRKVTREIARRLETCRALN